MIQKTIPVEDDTPNAFGTCQFRDECADDFRSLNISPGSPLDPLDLLAK